jgi:hypothetical protein
VEEPHKRLYERVLGTELTHLLGLRQRRGAQARGKAAPAKPSQRQQSKKTLISEDGKLKIVYREIAPESSHPVRLVLAGA